MKYLPCKTGIQQLDPWSMTADWRIPHRPRRRKQPIRGKDWRLSQRTISPSLRSAGQQEPRPRKPDTNKAPESPGAGRGNPEDRTLVSAIGRRFQKGRKKRAGRRATRAKITNNQLNNQPCKQSSDNENRKVLPPQPPYWEKTPKDQLKCPHRGNVACVLIP